MELNEGYNGVLDPKEFYSKYGNNNSKEIKEDTDEILDESYDDGQTETVNTGYYRMTEDGYAVPIGEAKARVYKDCPTYESGEDAFNSLPEIQGFGVLPEKRYLIREVPTIKVNYHKDRWPWLVEMEKNEKGDFIDLRAAEEYELKQGEFKLINLGISVQLPEGYHAEVVPRSSTYKNFGIIMSNSIGIIDESYCGDNDIWKFPAIAMRDTTIHTNDRICQFRIVKNRDMNIEVVDKLDNEDRGGIGSTGKN